MISEAVATTALSTVFSLALLWVLAVLYRRHRIDLFRHEMFMLRAELFDYARRGDIEFDHPAYAGLRTTLNGFLRYAERMGFLSTLLNLQVIRKVPADSGLWWWERHWQDALKTVSPAMRAELVAVRQRMHFALFEHLLLSSPLLVLTLVPYAFFSVIRHAGRHFLWKRVHRLYRKSEKLFERKVSQPLDDLAYQVGMAA